jgi:hypothetical protein
MIFVIFLNLFRQILSEHMFPIHYSLIIITFGAILATESVVVQSKMSNECFIIIIIIIIIVIIITRWLLYRQDST